MMTDQSKRLEEFERYGRVWLRNALSIDEVDTLRQLLTLDDRPGTRISHGTPLTEAIAETGFTSQLSKLWPKMKPVHLVSFNKTPATNWGVPWHQDRIIALDDQAEVPGYANWTQKAGVWHCEPPTALLETMLFVRVHLDENTAENGTMEIALGSHKAGVVRSDAAAALAETYDTELTLAAPGDVLVLAMLTLHRSLPSTSQGSRRALRIDYCPTALPKPLNWAS